MSEITGEMPTPASSEMPPATTEPEKPNTLESLQAEMGEIRAALKKANNEAAKYRKAAEEALAEKKLKEEAELSEIDKLRRQLADTEAQAKALRLDGLKTKVAAEIGLPPAFAARLQGEDEDALKADAKSLLEAIPKQPATPKIQPTNPANAQAPTETAAMRRQRIYSGGSTGGMFDAAGMEKRGGGVVWQEKT